MTLFVVNNFLRHIKEPGYCCGFPRTGGVRPGTLLSCGLMKDLLSQFRKLLLQILEKATDSKMRKKTLQLLLLFEERER